MNKDVPDITVDWDSINYNTRSDGIRPSAGWRVCTKCGNCLPINTYHFRRKRNNPDGYAYQCKECERKYRLARKEKLNEKNIKSTKENNA